MEQDYVNSFFMSKVVNLMVNNLLLFPPFGVNKKERIESVACSAVLKYFLFKPLMHTYRDRFQNK